MESFDKMFVESKYFSIFDLSKRARNRVKGAKNNMNYFFAYTNDCTLLEFSVIQQTEKAFKCEVVRYGISVYSFDVLGYWLGYAWVPKKAVIKPAGEDVGVRKLAKWYEIKTFGATSKGREEFERKKLKTIEDYNSTIDELKKAQ